MSRVPLLKEAKCPPSATAYESEDAEGNAIQKPVKSLEPLKEAYSMLVAQNKLLVSQLSATSERQSFLEDCVAEMATLVYTV